MSFFALLVVLMAGLNVALLVQNRTLKAAAAKPGGGSRSVALKAGKALPTLTGLDAEGRKLTFDYGADLRKTVLLIFSPRCPYCTENMPNWRALAQGIDPKSYRVVAVSLLPEGVKEYVATHGLSDVPVIADPDPKNRVAYEMNLTPQTLLIGQDGTAEKVWTGLLRGAERDEVEQLLGVELPPPASK
jgi:peroxiredoxin